MKIAVINTLPIPSGEASVNRILSYAKELRLLGYDITLVSTACADTKTGLVSDVPFYNVGTRTLFGSLCKLFFTLKQKQFEIVIVVTSSLLLVLSLWFFSIFLHYKLVNEKSEYPFPLMKKGLLRRLYALYYVNITYRLFDGMIVMTKPLMEYYKNKVRKKCKMMYMPMTVDTERFNIVPVPNAMGDYLAYCGNMSNSKDGIVNLINSFVMVELQHPDVKLLLIGGTNDESYLNSLKQKVADLGLKNVVFYGKVSRDEMPSLLLNAKALLLARPSSLQATGGFPTKLGEYLATGKPVVVTAVGDIPLYLNRTNSYIVQPDDNELFAAAINEILDNYDKALEVGKEGKKLADTVFNAKVQTDRLDKYLLTL